MPEYSKGLYRFRTWLRSNLPWFIINTGIIDKGINCEDKGGHHQWYKQDEEYSACYHCSVKQKGQLWKNETHIKKQNSACGSSDAFSTRPFAGR